MSLNFSVADLTIHRLVELNHPYLPALEMLPTLTPELLEENRVWLQPDSLGAGDVFNICFQSYVVRTPHHTILVDSCLGNDKPRGRPEWSMKTDARWMCALAAADLTVEDIDYVMCTHMHGDHVGWNTKLVKGEWVPTFPNARYLFGRREMLAVEATDGLLANAAYRDSVLPIVQAGRAELVDDDYQLGDHLRILPTPGHTDGHVSFCFGKARDEVVIAGDLIHVPLQTRYPELSFTIDKDPVLAASTRRSFLERYCDTPTLCCTSHFPSPSVGRVKRWGDGYRLEYIGSTDVNE
ncbi:MBL fold metallo-hydrolase [Ramlibacter sp. 2FC]|uniref:MBL fold metallo-hydrolase n=1 Tax=Ramlibacter sp. 2FC TaxID=2502188 RepID=UPI0010F8A8BC|nr:MBL fold metallo-hydrolase [Ramlibacter sp. 2FC]